MCFGLSPEQVGELTYKEYETMMDLYNQQLKNNYEMQRNVIFNAIINANRKQNTKAIPLFDEENDKSKEEIINERKELFSREILTL